ncbi:hrp65 protein-like isoform X2 [Homarus americanus]|uniref:hrp65 protein-like isoform X2 n=1 Tax=Homarus americanus TaxID=6706 RepID=UPI001C4810E5|nr:hrp65 protein-like isoform X2 [Homarus americanus]
MAMDAQAQAKNMENVKKEPQTPKASENGENTSNFRGGGGRGGRGGFRGNRGGGGPGGRGGGGSTNLGNVQTSTQVPGGIGSLGASSGGGSSSSSVGRGGGGGGGGGGSNSHNNTDNRNDQHPHQHHQQHQRSDQRGGGGGYYRGGRGRGGRGGGGGGGGGGSNYGDREGSSQRNQTRLAAPQRQYTHQDRILERLKQLAGPLIDLPPREEAVRKFSNHCRLWVGNLPLDIKEDDVKELFKPYGEFDEVYFDKNKGFAFVRMDFKSNAEKARQELHLKDYKGRQLKIRFSSPGTALKIRNLSTWVTNELLEKAFSVFGELEKAIVITDERGRATGEGIVEFCKKPSANLALKKCNEGCFFMVSSPRPVIVEQMALVDDNEGMSEINVNKRNPEYVKERQQGPRFAHPGSFEYEYGLKWKQLYELFDKKKDALDKELQDEKRKLEEQIEYAKYEHETEMLREHGVYPTELRQREEMNQRTKSDYEARQREWEEHRRTEEERQRRQEEELSLKFRQQEEELRRRQEENRQFMQERASDMLKNENSQDSFGSTGYQGTEGSNWRRNSDSYRSQGGSSWRGGGSDSWGRSGMAGSRGGTSSSGLGSSWADSSWDGRPDPWQSDSRSAYQRGSSESELPPPPTTNHAGGSSSIRNPGRGEEKEAEDTTKEDPNTFLENFNRGRNFEQEGIDYAGQRGRDAGRSRWGRNDHDDYGPAKRARY